MLSFICKPCCDAADLKRLGYEELSEQVRQKCRGGTWCDSGYAEKLARQK